MALITMSLLSSLLRPLILSFEMSNSLSELCCQIEKIKKPKPSIWSFLFFRMVDICNIYMEKIVNGSVI